MAELTHEQQEDALLLDLCREAGDLQLIEGARSNHNEDDIRAAATGDVAALVKLRQAFGLPIFA